MFVNFAVKTELVPIQAELEFTFFYFLFLTRMPRSIHLGRLTVPSTGVRRGVRGVQPPNRKKLL